MVTKFTADEVFGNLTINKKIDSNIPSADDVFGNIGNDTQMVDNNVPSADEAFADVKKEPLVNTENFWREYGSEFKDYLDKMPKQNSLSDVFKQSFEALKLGVKGGLLPLKAAVEGWQGATTEYAKQLKREDTGVVNKALNVSGFVPELKAAWAGVTGKETTGEEQARAFLPKAILTEEFNKKFQGVLKGVNATLEKHVGKADVESLITNPDLKSVLKTVTMPWMAANQMVLKYAEGKSVEEIAGAGLEVGNDPFIILPALKALHKSLTVAGKVGEADSVLGQIRKLSDAIADTEKNLKASFKLYPKDIKVSPTKRLAFEDITKTKSFSSGSMEAATGEEVANYIDKTLYPAIEVQGAAGQTKSIRKAASEISTLNKKLGLPEKFISETETAKKIATLEEANKSLLIPESLRALPKKVEVNFIAPSGEIKDLSLKLSQLKKELSVSQTKLTDAALNDYDSVMAAIKDHPVRNAGVKTWLDNNLTTSLFKSMDKDVPGLGTLFEKGVVRTKDKVVGEISKNVFPYFERLKSKEQQVLFSRILEGEVKTKPGSVMDELVKTVRKYYDETWTLAEEAGIKTQVLQKDGNYIKEPLHRIKDFYFTHSPTSEFFEIAAKKGSSKFKLIKELQAKHPGMTEGRAEEVVQKYIMRKAIPKFSPLELERIPALPDKYIRREDSFEVFMNYMNGAHERIARAKVFGPNNEKAYKLMDKAASGDIIARERMGKLFTALEGGGALQAEADAKAFHTVVRSLQVRKLVASAIRQPSQFVSILTRTANSGPGPAFKALVQSFTKAGKEIALGVSATQTNEFSKITGINKTWASKFMKWTGFAWTDNKLREISAIAGAGHVKQMFNKYQKTGADKYLRELKTLGVDVANALKNGALSADDIKNAAWEVNKSSNFLSHHGYLPLFWSTEGGKTITQFKTFAYHQGRELYNYAIKEAVKHGNMKPMAAFAVGSATIGLPVVAAYRIFTGKDLPASEGEWIYEAFSFGGPGVGIVKDIAESGAYGKTGVYGFVAGPSITDLVNGADAVYQATFNGNTNPLAKFTAQQVVRPVPYVGPYVYGNITKGLSKKGKKKKSSSYRGFK